MNITERTHLEHEVKTKIQALIKDFLLSEKAAKAVSKIFATNSLLLEPEENELVREEAVIQDVLIELRAAAVQLSPADLEVSTITDLVSKGK